MFCLLAAFVLIAAATPAAAKDALTSFPPLTMGFIRFVTAAALLGITLRLRASHDGVEPIAKSDRWRFVLAAILCVPVNQSTYLLGVKLAGVAHAGLLYGLTPVLIYALTLLVGSSRWSARHALATFLAFGGAVAVVSGDFRFEVNGSVLLGDALLFGAVFSWAWFSLVVGKLTLRYGSLRTMFLVMAVGALLYSPVLAIDGRQLVSIRPTFRAVLGLGFVSVLTSYLNYVLWAYAISRFDMNRVAVNVSVAPLLAVVIGHFWHSEPITSGLAIGGALIFVAMILAASRLQPVSENRHLPASR